MLDYHIFCLQLDSFTTFLMIFDAFFWDFKAPVLNRLGGRGQEERLTEVESRWGAGGLPGRSEWPCKWTKSLRKPRFLLFFVFNF